MLAVMGLASSVVRTSVRLPARLDAAGLTLRIDDRDMPLIDGTRGWQGSKTGFGSPKVRFALDLECGTEVCLAVVYGTTGFPTEAMAALHKESDSERTLNLSLLTTAEGFRGCGYAPAGSHKPSTRSPARSPGPPRASCSATLPLDTPLAFRIHRVQLCLMSCSTGSASNTRLPMWM